MSCSETQQPCKKQKTLLDFFNKDMESMNNQTNNSDNKDSTSSCVIEEAKSGDMWPDIFPELSDDADSQNSKCIIKTKKLEKKNKKCKVKKKGNDWEEVDYHDLEWKLCDPSDLKGDLGTWGVPQLPPVKPSTNHSVLYEIAVSPSKEPQPFPHPYKDAWDSQHVRLPCSPQSLYPVQLEEQDKEKSLVERWKIVKEALSRKLDSSEMLQAAIVSYNTRYSDMWDFSTLHFLFGEEVEPEESEYFFSKTLPAMQQLALRLPELFVQPIPLLRRKRAASVTLTQEQIACLVANAFFCTYPRRNSDKRESEYATFPKINFNKLFQETSPNSSRRVEKVKCLLHYFRRVTSEVPTGTVTYCRQVLLPDACPSWGTSEAPLPKLAVSTRGTIEKDGIGMLQVDFANKFVGGGVLRWGCVQEEIRFVICPELIAACLFTEALEANECLVIAGCERYSNYSGYAESFRWIGDHRDETPRDDSGRRLTTVLAVDALRFRNTSAQYFPDAMKRELDKAYCGFRASGIPKLHLTPVATGNWGCGAFRGDPRLKSLLQLMSAAVAGRSLAYFTFGDENLSTDICDMYNCLQEKGVTVGRLWKLLCGYHSRCSENGRVQMDLYKYLCQAVKENTSSGRESLDYPSRNLSATVSSGASVRPTGSLVCSSKSLESSTTAKCGDSSAKILSEAEIQEALANVADDESIPPTVDVSKSTVEIKDDPAPENTQRSRMLASLEALDSSQS